jgi:xylulokinase
MDAEISSVEPGADRLAFISYLQGERTPDLPGSCGVLHGMNTANTTSVHHDARAVMEGFTLGIVYGLRRVEQLGVKAEVIRLTGGGSDSPAWRQRSDIFGYPAVTLRSPEGGALGMAIQAIGRRWGWTRGRCGVHLVRIDGERNLEPRRDFQLRRSPRASNRAAERAFRASQ